MRVLSAPVNDWVDPAAAFTALHAHDSHAIWLDSGMHATTGMSVIGSASRSLTASVPDGTVHVDGRVRPGTVFEFLKGDLSRRAVPEAGEFALGWVGWLGYELRAQTMGGQVRRRSRYPDAGLVYLDRAVVFDHAARSVSLLALGDGWDESLVAWREDVTAKLAGATSLPPEPAVPAHGPAPTWAYTDKQYLDMIRECQSAIAAGDAYLLCLTTEARLEVNPDPVSAYLALRRSSPTHHGAFLRLGDVSVLSASPERFLTVSPRGVVRTSPIKGTRRRDSDPAEDARLAEELRASEKERAENLMIVDLMRNDIGRIASLGSVRVSDLLSIETYAQVHQLVSTVEGTLAEGVTGVDAVVSCFPAGSMTGTPKHSATDILDRLEHRARGIYSGALGYFGLDGRIDLAMVIRSIVLDADGATIGTGGGITALSVPEEELQEVYLKAAALLRVLESAG